MGFPLALQAEGFFSSLLLGIVLALLYDLLRALRVHRGAARALTGVLDALYCLLFSLLVFLFSLRVGGGELRLYMIAAALAGALFYFLLAARLLRPLWAFWAEVVFSLCALAAAPLRALKRAYGKLAKLCKRYFLFSRNRLIINAYGRGAMRAQRRTRKKGGAAHGKGQGSEEAHELSHDARDRGADRPRGRAAHPSACADRDGAG